MYPKIFKLKQCNITIFNYILHYNNIMYIIITRMVEEKFPHKLFNNQFAN